MRRSPIAARAARPNRSTRNCTSQASRISEASLQATAKVPFDAKRAMRSLRIASFAVSGI